LKCSCFGGFVTDCARYQEFLHLGSPVVMRRVYSAPECCRFIFTPWLLPSYEQSGGSCRQL
jgi:hypothetical protein